MVFQGLIYYIYDYKISRNSFYPQRLITIKGVFEYVKNINIFNHYLLHGFIGGDDYEERNILSYSAV